MACPWSCHASHFLNELLQTPECMLYLLYNKNGAVTLKQCVTPYMWQKLPLLHVLWQSTGKGKEDRQVACIYSPHFDAGSIRDGLQCVGRPREEIKLRPEIRNLLAVLSQKTGQTVLGILYNWRPKIFCFSFSEVEAQWIKFARKICQLVVVHSSPMTEVQIQDFIFKLKQQ